MQEVVLITGGGGFLGFNLLLKLVQSNYAKKYVVIDNFITSDLQRFRDNISRHEIGSYVDLINDDICNTSVVSRIMENYSIINEIYHFASLASPPFYKRHPIETLDVGYIGTKNVLDLCKFYKKCRLLYSSTSEVYGDALVHPQKEDYYGNVNTYGERSCYDESKRIGETLIYTYQQLYNIDARIVRIFNTYGPYMSLGDGRIVTEIIRCLLSNDTLKIFGDGQQTRSLSFVDDTLGMMLRVMESDFSRPVNVGNEFEVSVNTLVKTVCEVYDQILGVQGSYETLKKEYISIDKDDPKVRRPDLTLNKQVVGDYQRTDLTHGLRMTLMYFIGIH